MPWCSITNRTATTTIQPRNTEKETDMTTEVEKAEATIKSLEDKRQHLV
jgi:hypothetical protein